MKILLGTMVLAGANVKEGPQGFDYDGQRIVQTQTFLRGKTSRPKGRENRSVTLAFTVTREHGSFAEAEKFCQRHDLDVPTEGTLTIESGEGASMVRTFAQYCVVNSVAIRYDGQITHTTYRLSASAFQIVKPTA